LLEQLRPLDSLATDQVSNIADPIKLSPAMFRAMDAERKESVFG
jgi:hypothetical protein